MKVLEVNEKVLVQASVVDTGEPLGLYLVPKGKVDEFENELNLFGDQDKFDEDNSVDAERVFAEEVFKGDYF